MQHGPLLFPSPFLLGIGFAMLGGFLIFGVAFLVPNTLYGYRHCSGLRCGQYLAVAGLTPTRARENQVQRAAAEGLPLKTL